MIDLVTLTLIAGRGGHGRVSFRREKFVPRGGPDGGDGGHGGSVILRATTKYNTLHHLAGFGQLSADEGGDGGKRDMHGADAQDFVIEVPVGTVVWLLAENKVSAGRRKHPSREGHAHYKPKRVHYEVEREGQSIPPSPVDEVEWERPLDENGEPITDWRQLPKEQLMILDHDGQEYVVCKGGAGGHGNVQFKSPSRTTPMDAEYGGIGEQKQVLLELKLLAHVGLVGLPNAGKSTILSRLTKAKPKIANYPFTTLEPHLGVMPLPTKPGQPDRNLVMADIPGLIEGASEGKGLGYQFLRHIENCRALLMVLNPASEGTDLFNAVAVARELEHQHAELLQELAAYNPDMAEKPVVVAVNKTDLILPEVRTLVNEELAFPVIWMSAATGEGLSVIIEKLDQLVAAGEATGVDDDAGVAAEPVGVTPDKL